MQITLFEALASRGVSLYQMALDLGIPARTAYYWRAKNRIPKAELLDALCEYLGCGIEELLLPEKCGAPVYSPEPDP